MADLIRVSCSPDTSQWASALPGFLCLACMPFPFLFYKYGGAIRAKCRYAAEAQKILEQMLQRSAAPAPAPPPPPAAVSAAQDDDLEKEVVSEQSHHDATGSSDHDEIRTAPHGGGLSTAAASTAHGHVVEKVETG